MADAAPQSTPTQSNTSLPAGQDGASAPPPAAAQGAAPATPATQPDATPATSGGVLADVAKPDQQAGDAKPEGTPPQADAPPAELVLTVPEGMPEGFFNDEHLKSFAEFAKENGITQEQANKALEFEAKRIADINAAQSQQWEATKSDWEKQLRESFGQQYEAKVQAAKKAFVRFGPQGEEAAQFAADMAAMGIGNYPALVKWAAAVGEALGEDSSGGGSGGSGHMSEAELLHKRYPNSVNPDGTWKDVPTRT